MHLLGSGRGVVGMYCKDERGGGAEGGVLGKVVLIAAGCAAQRVSGGKGRGVSVIFLHLAPL